MGRMEPPFSKRQTRGKVTTHERPSRSTDTPSFPFPGVNVSDDLRMKLLQSLPYLGWARLHSHARETLQSNHRNFSLTTHCRDTLHLQTDSSPSLFSLPPGRSCDFVKLNLYQKCICHAELSDYKIPALNPITSRFTLTIFPLTILTLAQGRPTLN